MTAPALPRAPGRPALAALAAAVLATGLLLWWAKWSPYTAKVGDLVDARAWSGTSLLDAAGVEPGSGPSLSAGLSFTRAYAAAVWKAVLTGLVMAAAVQALVPRARLVALLSRARSTSSALVGGLAATPSMMCTCCAAPVASALRRSGAPTSAAVAYWLANPLLNPAVLVFLLLVAPWPWAATRLVVGLLLVVAGSALVARLADRRGVPDPAPAGSADLPRPRFVPTLARLALVVVPEYLVVVFAVGVFSGWLFPLGDDAASWGALALVLAVVLGTLLVVPTAGEIPLAQGLALTGAGLGAVGALLVVLPAVSLPSMAMVARALSWRVALATAGVVAAGGLVAAALLPALSAL